MGICTVRHGKGAREGKIEGIEFKLVSSDHMKFDLIKVE